MLPQEMMKKTAQNQRLNMFNHHATAGPQLEVCPNYGPVCMASRICADVSI